MNRTKHNQGLTLLEMAIVLMIIAAITAGILLGRSLLVSSQLQTVMTDADNYIKAIDNFKQAYGGLPGDLTNAESLWGTDSSGCPSGGGSTGTCNGNGDGKVGSACVSPTYTITYAYEMFRAWQQLASAGLYNNALNGITASATAVTSLGTNTPIGSMEGSGFVLHWLDDPALCSNITGLLTSSGAHGNALILANKIAVAATPSFTITPVLTPEQASGIDSKIDDGVPGTGRIRSFGAGTSGCTTTNEASTAAYALTSTTRLCAPIFLTGF